MATVWRLVTHHARKDETLEEYQSEGYVAIGWSKIGPIDPRFTAKQLTQLVKDTHVMRKGDQANWPFSGRQLYAFRNEMRPGDLVILSTGQRRCVMKLTDEPYYFEDGWTSDDEFYAHRLRAVLTNLNADDVWRKSGGAALGWNPRQALVKCVKDV